MQALAPISTRLKNHFPAWIMEPCAVFFITVIFVSSPVQAQKSPSQEYQVKAVFLFNFTQFVEWPDDAFPKKDSPFVIGLLGEDPFGVFLEETVRGEEMNGHPLIIQRYQKMEDIKPCHILYINLTRPDEMKKVSGILKSQPVLTVSDVNGFTKWGGMIGFVTENNKTRIRINLDAAGKADLVISSKLLKLAEIVSP